MKTTTIRIHFNYLVNNEVQQQDEAKTLKPEKLYNFSDYEQIYQLSLAEYLLHKDIVMIEKYYGKT